MARYRRKKKKDFTQEILGLVILLSVAASFSQPFRESMFFFVKFAIFMMVVAGVVAFSYKMKKNKIAKYVIDTVSTPRNTTTNRPLSKLEKEWERCSPASTCDASAEWALGGVKKDVPMTWSIDLLRALEWKRFETVCNEYLKTIGYDARETRIGPDGGVDIIVHKEGQEKPLAIVQCKAWNRYKVGVKPIRELFGLMAAEQVINGMFITTGDYTTEAREFANGKNLKLITGERLLEVIKQLPEEGRGRLLKLATEGDYATPTCPRCGIKMTIRENSKGRNAGNKFWGCVKFPKCRSTLVFKQQ